ncbi:hypothetical protein MPTK2_2g12360 [Marchantia polymorpha subsp. ruderalis]
MQGKEYRFRASDNLVNMSSYVLQIGNRGESLKLSCPYRRSSAILDSKSSLLFQCRQQSVQGFRFRKR